MDKKDARLIEGKIVSYKLENLEQVETKTDGNEKGRHKRRRRRIKGFANTATVDRGGDFVDPKAFKSSLDSFMTNPVVFLNHDWSTPIGLVEDAKITSKGLQVEVEIAEGLPVSDQVWKMIDLGLLNSFSIGFKPIEMEYNKEMDAMHIKDLELLEVSVVTIPMNKDSQFSINSKGMFEDIKIDDSGEMITYKQLVGDVDIEEPSTEEEVETKSEEKAEEVEPDNSIRRLSLDFVDGACGVCGKEEVKVLSVAVHATGKEEFECGECFTEATPWIEEMDETRKSLEEENATLTEELEQVRAELSEVSGELAVTKEDVNRIVETLSSEIAELTANVAASILGDD
jgi:HK97 family phage prohead protease